MAMSGYGVAGLVVLLVLGAALLAGALCPEARAAPETTPAWAQFRFGFVVYALIFLAFDMEMIFMYPWAVVFAELGLAAFLDMLVFIALLSAGIAYAWGMGGFKWE
jgi:NADH-quinone oxidoreductase subunit A